MLITQRELLITRKGSTSGGGGHRLQYLQNGNNYGYTSARYSINTGIAWNKVFQNSSYSLPGLEVVLLFQLRLYDEHGWAQPDGRFVAGSAPFYPSDGSLTPGGMWRFFLSHVDGWTYALTLDCPTDGSRCICPGPFPAPGTDWPWVTVSQKFEKLSNSTYRSSLICRDMTGKVTSWTRSFQTSPSDGTLYNLYLFKDITQADDVLDSQALEGYKIGGYTVYYLDNGVRTRKVYEGVPWMDSNNVPCIKDLVGGQLQYNCASNPSPFLYGEIQ